jgi:hypothetical protein
MNIKFKLLIEKMFFANIGEISFYKGRLYICTPWENNSTCKVRSGNTIFISDYLEDDDYLKVSIEFTNI